MEEESKKTILAEPSDGVGSNYALAQMLKRRRAQTMANKDSREAAKGPALKRRMTQF